MLKKWLNFHLESWFFIQFKLKPEHNLAAGFGYNLMKIQFILLQTIILFDMIMQNVNTVQHLSVENDTYQRFLDGPTLLTILPLVESAFLGDNALHYLE